MQVQFILKSTGAVFKIWGSHTNIADVQEAIKRFFTISNQRVPEMQKEQEDEAEEECVTHSSSSTVDSNRQ